ncbi:bifunctional [glutamate--ammonia ligase]-adenylyl-L-tyrosine phosphorylase/[glutamate--ammonia-ligase] adenylyltransferase [Nitrospina sp. 32_T5]|uniref:bifunctional [glutamate--ammonia ligase]-adenylyl-L-tyrosine phosphorylase/[glutamate--ammonia-ligase] adenylyltransferase n=1 Tax=unclassified Nitrospina TaxID=2638683 RepID=UPI003F9466BF
MNVVTHLSSLVLEGETWSDSWTQPLSGVGFDDPKKAWHNLMMLKEQANFHELYPAFFPSLLECLEQCYDPDLALNNFERLSSKLPDKEHLYSFLTRTPDFLNALMILFSGSQVLTDSLLRHPEFFDWLVDPETLNTSRTKDQLYRDYYTMMDRAASGVTTTSLLRKFKKREYIRIGLRDLMGRADTLETLEDLSNLADVCLQVAYEHAHRELVNKHGAPMFRDHDGTEKESEFTILAMGKLGGRELNYSSDIDLIYIYTSAEGETKAHSLISPTSGTITCYEFHTKLGQRITRLINEITSDGNVFRVDLNLRPEGQNGEIAHSLSFCETYYESVGRTWERQALIKARVSAGSEKLGQQFFSMIRPFVYRKTLDFNAIEEVKALKRKVDANLKQKKQEKGNIKLGFGGIREIEFIIQSYQLLFGGRDSSLRDTGTLSTLAKLKEREFVGTDEYNKLYDAYIFLRNLENRVQLTFGLQTYSIPRETRSQAVLARKMGCQAGNVSSLADNLQKEFERHTCFVGAMFDQLFSEDKDQKAAHDTSQKWDARQDIENRFSEEYLSQYPFNDSKRAFQFLCSLRDGPSSKPATERGIQTFYKVLPQVLNLCRKVPNANFAVENLVKFVEASKARETYLDLFNDNEKFLELLLILFGSSETLSTFLIKQPNFIDVLSNVESLYRFKTPEKMKRGLDDFLSTCETPEQRNLSLRWFKQAEELRIGTRYLIHEADLPGTLLDLSNLADLYLQSVLELAWKRIQEGPANSAPREGFAIMGLGKLGGRELNFGSDLDIVFVYDNKEEDPESDLTAMTLYSQLAQGIFQLSSESSAVGPAYKIDTDLRPEGSRGALVLSLKGYKDYFESRGRIWEQQAMTRARFIAGDRELGDRFLEVTHKFTYRSKLEYGSLIEIARLRERMEKELAEESKKGRNVKLGHGGLADIEFTVQILQLMHGRRNPKLRATNTLEVINTLSAYGILQYEQAEALQKHYEFLRNVECSLRLINPQFSSHLPKDPVALQTLARILGYKGENGGAAEELMRDYEETTQSVRTFYTTNVDTFLRTAL